MPLTAEIMDQVAIYVCLPWMLLLNFSLFQYLATTYFRRRRETRVALLIACAFLSFLSLTLFAYPDTKFVQNMNNISEVCSVLTFLLQITVICRDVTKRVKVKSLWLMTFAAETLIVFEIAIVVFNIVENCTPNHQLVSIGEVDRVVLKAALAFVFFFRFHYASLTNKGGWRGVWATRRAEVILYLMLVTHQYPFILIDHATGVSWIFVQGLYMRVLIIACLALTLREKLRLSSPRRGSNDSAETKKRQAQAVVPMPHVDNIAHAHESS